MHAYINGMDVWWILVIDLVMLIAGIIGVFLALILPEHYQFRGKLFLTGAFTAIIGIAICFVMVRLRKVRISHQTQKNAYVSD